MQISKLTRIILSLAITSSTLSLPAFAKGVSESCELGNECNIPGNDGGQTHFNVTPNTGMKYLCEVKSLGGSLKFSVTSGKHFEITQGGGLYHANTNIPIEITGRFEKPNDPQDAGEIRFTQMPFSAEGTVKCVTKK